MRKQERASKGAARGSALLNPHPHRMVGEVEVTAWPDHIVGVAIPKTVVSFLLTPYLAFQLAAALVEMASKASARQRPQKEELKP